MRSMAVARPKRRSVLLAFGIVLSLGRPASASRGTMVEDWRGQPEGVRGIPPGWKPYPTPGGRSRYDFTVVNVDGLRALHLKSQGDRSTIARAVDVDLRTTPILEWSWKTVRLPAGADVRASATSDSAANVLVVWPRSPEVIRSRIIAYAWDTTAPAHSIERSRKSGTVTFVIVRSGPVGLAQWLTERRNVHADYRRIYGEEPDPVRALALSIDTNDTRAPAEAFVGPIAFRTS
jgi:hypothetical protein